MTEARVSVSELGIAHIDELAGFKVESDWRGDLSVSRVDAGKFLAERRRRADESTAAAQAVQVEAEGWLAGRAAAGREAQAALAGGRAASPELYSRGRRAYVEAAIRFQDEHPRPAGVAEGVLIELADVEMSV
ncbi:MAG: hypothetical protein ACRDZ0_00700 [Acidimicrobiales bacterium]